MLEALLRRQTRPTLRLVPCALALLIVCGFAQAQHRPQITPPAAPQPPARPAPFGADSDVKAEVKAPANNGSAPAGSATTTRTRLAPAETTATPKSDAASTPADANDLDALRTQIETTSADGERGRLQRQLVERLATASDKGAALSELRLLLHEDRFDPPFFYNLGNALARLGDASAATDAYRKAISQRRGHYARALNNLGVILTRQGQWEEAHDALVAALGEEHNTYAEASYNLGRLYLLRGEAGLAIREWQHTLALEPTHADAATALARAYAEDGDAKRGLAVLDAYTARTTRTGAGVPLPVVYARREIAVANVSPAKDENAGGANANGMDVNRADVRSANVNRAASARTAIHPLAVDPTTYDLLQRARAARDASRHEAAVKAYRDVLARSGGYFPPANLELAFALANLRRNDEAIAALTTLTEHDGARYPVAYYHLGRLYESAGQLDRAAANFTRAAELYGDTNPQMLVDVTRVREKLGDDAGALAALESFIKIIEREGTTPTWAQEKLTKLRARVATANAAHTP
jgi:tetratricopeptide (TPR) repeat protein